MEYYNYNTPHVSGVPWDRLDVALEKQRITELIGIPVTNVAFSSYYCELFFKQISIGFIPVEYQQESIVYKTTKEILAGLNWKKLCQSNKTEITNLIKSYLNVNTVVIIPTSFKKIYVEDSSENLIASFECSFENGAWKIRDEKIIVSL